VGSTPVLAPVVLSFVVVQEVLERVVVGHAAVKYQTVVIEQAGCQRGGRGDVGQV